VDKRIDIRISYYTRKVAEYGATHVNKERNTYRYGRLIRYNRRLNEIAGRRNRKLKVQYVTGRQ